MIKTNIKNQLKETGRLPEIYNIFTRLRAKEQYDYPLVHSSERPLKSDVVKGINKFYEIIETTGEKAFMEDTQDLEALEKVVNSETEMRLHNYAVSCSHGNIPDEEILEEIRTWEILDSCLNSILYGYLADIDTGEYVGLLIPDGWKKPAKKTKTYRFTISPYFSEDGEIEIPEDYTGNIEDYIAEHFEEASLSENEKDYSGADIYNIEEVEEDGI